MHIKEEIITEVLRLCAHTGIPSDLFTVTGGSACVMHGFSHGSKYIQLECCPTVLDDLHGIEDVDVVHFQPKLPWNKVPTEGFLIDGKFTVLEGGAPADDRVDHDYGVYTLKQHEVLEAAKQRGIYLPYAKELEKLFEHLHDARPDEVSFMRQFVSFDSYYHYSDDINVYRRGVEQERKLCNMIKENPRYKLISELFKKT